jgi:hypothetical protein
LSAYPPRVRCLEINRVEFLARSPGKSTRLNYRGGGAEFT